jgi:hypothetical protein
MVLGADPDAKIKEWPDEPINTASLYRCRPDVRELSDHFAYHKGMTMGMRCDTTDRVILNRLLSRRMDQGYTKESLRHMIDRFFQSWAKDYQLPVLAFVSKAVQDTLTREAEVVKGDPILRWLLDGMPDQGPFENCKEMRKAVLVRADNEVMSRYPDVVADVLRIEGTYERTLTRLSLLNKLVTRKLQLSPFPVEVDDAAMKRILPPELLGGGPLRLSQGTIQQAIGALPIKKAR